MHLLLFLLLSGGAAPAQESPFRNLKFREIGPATVSGRIDDFAVLESNPSVFYVASATGGIWKTTNAGTTFEAQFQNESTSTIGDVAIAPSDANLVWAGTGENNNRQSSSWGDGIFKSTDGGRTWKNMGLRQSHHIARIIVDPVDHDVVYVAALGSVWGSGGDRGVYKTTDGGVNWTRILHVDDDTGATELVMDPSNNKVLYAASYQRRRTAWGFNGGGPGSAIWKSADAGRTWTKLTKGVPDGDKGRIGLDVFRRNPNILYARIEHEKESGVYRSDDAGATWRKMSNVNPRPMYFSQIRVDPRDDQRVYVLGISLHVSDDGGRTFRTDGARRIHVDFHAMWINPNDPDHVILGGDGGVGISHDRSQTYAWLNNLPVSQFYHISPDMRDPYYVCGGLQDNNSFCGPSAVRSADGIANDDWFIISGGDGFVAATDPDDLNILYGESQGGRIQRIDRVTNERKLIQPAPPAGEKPYRWNWDTPFQISAHNASALFIGAHRVFQSTDRGHSWKAVSPDLTTAPDRERLKIMNVTGKDTKLAKNDGVSDYGTITTFAESSVRGGLYFAGTDDGQLHVCKDAGAKWENVTSKIPGLPPNTYVAKVAPSRFDEKVVYAAFDGHRSNDFNTYLYVSRDQGTTWKPVTSGFPRGEVVRTITEDHRNPEVLYAGTETGLFGSFDGGQTWERIKANLPTVPIYEIALHKRDNAIILATHGRGIWILDDIAPFQAFSSARKSGSPRLFAVRDSVTRSPSGEHFRGWQGDRIFLGKNPDPGVVIQYYLPSAAKEVALVIKDSSGAQIREIKGDALKDTRGAGIQSFSWDRRVQPLPPVRTAAPQQAFAGRGGSPGMGPIALPGTYEVALTVDGTPAGAQRFSLTLDPEIRVSQSDLKKRFDAQMKIHGMGAKFNAARDSLTGVRERLTAMRNALRDNKEAGADLKKRIADLDKQFLPVGRDFGAAGPMSFEQTTTGDFQLAARALQFRLGGLAGAIAGSTSALTEQQEKQLDEITRALPGAIAKANEIISATAKLAEELAAKGIYPPALRTVE